MTTFRKKGTLKGTDTKDIIEFMVDLPADISYTVKATGSGNNELRVRSSQKLILIWARIHDFKLDMGQTKSRSFSTSIDGTTPTTDDRQMCRFKLTRKVLTAEIKWEVTWTVT